MILCTAEKTNYQCRFHFLRSPSARVYISFRKPHLHGRIAAPLRGFSHMATWNRLTMGGGLYSHGTQFVTMTKEARPNHGKLPVYFALGSPPARRYTSTLSEEPKSPCRWGYRNEIYIWQQHLLCSVHSALVSGHFVPDSAATRPYPSDHHKMETLRSRPNHRPA